MKTDIVQKAIIFNKEGDILLLRRGADDSRRPSQWDLPGGLLDEGELLSVGISREIKEETGFKVDKLVLFFGKTEPAIWTDELQENQESSVLRLYYATHVSSLGVTLSNEHSEFSWASLEDALEIIEYIRHKEVISYIINNQLEL